MAWGSDDASLVDIFKRTAIDVGLNKAMTTHRERLRDMDVAAVHDVARDAAFAALELFAAHFRIELHVIDAHHKLELERAMLRPASFIIPKEADHGSD